MEKWIFVNNITSLDKLYFLTKTINENKMTDANQAKLLMNALNNNGANRTEANNHPLNYVLFYDMVYQRDGVFELTKNGLNLINNYEQIKNDKSYRAIFFFSILNNIKYPNIAVETSSVYNVHPLNIIFRLLCDERLSKKISIDEMENILSGCHNDDEYEYLVQEILKYRNNQVLDLKCEKIAQISTVVAGWINQFNVMKKEGEYVMLSNDLKNMLPILSNESTIKKIPFNNEFSSIVLKKYLFDGSSMSSIENEYYNSNDRKGFFVKDVLDYYNINNEQNRAIYREKSIEFVCSLLEIQSDTRFKIISSVLKGIEVTEENYYFELFKKYYLQNINKLEKDYEESGQVKKREEFLNEYPLERLKNLSLEEYVLGTENYKDSLSYKLEYGKYKYTGAGIGGSTSKKFGIYMKEPNCYFGRNGIIDNPKQYWEELRNELYEYLTTIPNMKEPINVGEKYTHLMGMSMVITKLSFLYYPEKFINLCSKNWLLLLSNSFGFSLPNKYSSEQLSFSLSDKIRSNYDEVNHHDSQYLGSVLYNFLNEYILVSNEDKEEIEVDEKTRIKNAYNMIYYGTPGCGKSYLVNKKFNDNEYFIFRTTFHPEYSNSDFVGQIVPKTEENQIKYEFQEGPFSIALLNAILNPTQKVCLIIEEINRGNASAIFGDIFQLLDRDNEGNSIYSIVNEPIKNYLKSNGVNVEKITIPSNLWIIATMNTSDQNVFTLDTAFKRRWRMHRIVNKFDLETEYDKKLASMYIPGSTYTWEQFITTINDEIIRKNPTGLNSEDKQLGVYFVTNEELSFIPADSNQDNIDKFVEKVLLYIWDDVAKIGPSLWFGENIKSFDDLIKEYNEKKLEVFRDIFKEQMETLQLREENE